MSKQSIVSEISISNVKAIVPRGTCGKIHVSWSPSGDATTYEVDRRPLNALVGATLVPPTQPVRSSYDDRVSNTQLYVYTVTVWDSLGNPAAANSNAARAIPCRKVSSGFLIQSRNGFFELLFAEDDHINHYRHRKGSILTGHWERVHTLYAPEGGAIPDNAVSLIENTSGNLEAVAVVTPRDKGRNYLVSYEFVPESSGWRGPSILKVDGAIITGVTGNPTLIQTREGPYLLFVPQGNFIGRHMHQEGPIQDGDWMPLPPFGTSDTLTYTAISLVQTASDQLELIARVTPTQNPQHDVIPDYLVSFVSRSVDPQAPFDHVGPLLADGQPINGVTGGPSFIQNAEGIFVLIVPLGASMKQYILETDSIGANLWKLVSTLEPLKNDPGIQFTATSLIESISKKLDLVARATPPQGEGEDYPVAYEFTGWSRPRPIIVDGTSSDEDNDRDK